MLPGSSCLATFLSGPDGDTCIKAEGGLFRGDKQDLHDVLTVLFLLFSFTVS